MHCPFASLLVFIFSLFPDCTAIASSGKKCISAASIFEATNAASGRWGHRAPGEAADGPHLALPLGLRLHLRDGLSRFAARRRIGRAINVIYRLRKLYIDDITRSIH